MPATHILYISYDGMTDPLGQSQVIPYLQGLSKMGYRFTILSFEKKERFELHKAKIQALLSKSEIDWEPMTYHGSPPLIGSMYDLFKGEKKAVQIAQQKKINIVQARGHHLVCMMAMAVKKQTGAVFLYDMRGFWPDERVEGGHWNLRNPLYKLIYNYFKQKEKLFFKYADGMITLTFAAKDYLEINYRIGDKITVIPCAADLEHFVKAEESKQETLKERLGLKNKFIFIISGSIGTWYLPNEMLDFFKTAKTKIPNAHLLLVTLDDTTSFLSYAKKIGISESDITVTSSSREDMSVFYSISDAAIMFIKAVFSKKASSPTKHGELLGCNVPVICNSGVGDMDLIMREKNTGAVIEQFVRDQYENALEKLLSTNFAKEDFEFVARKYYALESGVLSYDKAYKQLLSLTQ